MLNGSTKIAHRQNIVQSFNNDPDTQVRSEAVRNLVTLKLRVKSDLLTALSFFTLKILLLSLTAGGVGLNLCGANHLFFLDPHWNPQLESQAEDRIYRIGQTKPVTIYRYVMDGW